MCELQNNNANILSVDCHDLGDINKGNYVFKTLKAKFHTLVFIFYKILILFNTIEI